MARTMRPLSQRLLFLHRQFHATTRRHDSASHAELMQHLEEQDTLSLAKTRRDIATIGSAAAALSSVNATIASAAARIQLNPAIPPYKPHVWALGASNIPTRLSKLEASIDRLDKNLADLQAIPYSVQIGETPAQKIAKKIELATEEEKHTELRNLRMQEDAMMHRANTAIDSLHAAVMAEREKKGLPMSNIYRPDFRTINVTEKGKLNISGWGQGATSFAEEDETAQPKPTPKPLPTFRLRTHLSGEITPQEKGETPPTGRMRIRRGLFRRKSESGSDSAVSAVEQEESSKETEEKKESQASTPTKANSKEVEEEKKSKAATPTKANSKEVEEEKKSKAATPTKANGKENNEEKASKASTPSKPKGLLALQAELDKSLRP